MQLTSDKLPGPPLARDLPYTRQAKLHQYAQAREAAHRERVPRGPGHEEHAIDDRHDGDEVERDRCRDGRADEA